MRRACTVLLAALLCLVAVACVPPVIKGDAPLRYRDGTFTSTTKTADITYGTAVNQQGETVTLKLDVYQPTGDTATSRPLIVYVFGGSFCCGNRNSPELLDQIDVFTKKGYVTATIDYRLSTNGCRTVNAECVQAINDAKADARNAVRFLRSHAATYGIDPTRIAMTGTSAGAITALNVGYSADDGTPSPKVQAVISLSGAALTESPDSGEAPALMFHGTADTLVPYQWALNTHDAASGKGLANYLVTWQGDGHVPYTAHRDQILDLSARFLYDQLHLAPAA